MKRSEITTKHWRLFKRRRIDSRRKAQLIREAISLGAMWKAERISENEFNTAIHIIETECVLQYGSTYPIYGNIYWFLRHLYGKRPQTDSEKNEMHRLAAEYFKIAFSEYMRYGTGTRAYALWCKRVARPNGYWRKGKEYFKWLYGRENDF